MLDAERQDLATLRTVLAAKRVQYEDQVIQMTSERDAAIGDKDSALVRVADLQRLLDQQTAQLIDMATDRDSARLDAANAIDKLVVVPEYADREGSELGGYAHRHGGQSYSHAGSLAWGSRSCSPG